MEKPVGMYSATAKRKFGSVIWVDADGKAYEITAYVHPSKYNWDDAVIVTEKPITYHSQHTNGEDAYHCL